MKAKPKRSRATVWERICERESVEMLFKKKSRSSGHWMVCKTPFAARKVNWINTADDRSAKKGMVASTGHQSSPYNPVLGCSTPPIQASYRSEVLFDLVHPSCTLRSSSSTSSTRWNLAGEVHFSRAVIRHSYDMPSPYEWWSVLLVARAAHGSCASATLRRHPALHQRYSAVPLCCVTWSWNIS